MDTAHVTICGSRMRKDTPSLDSTTKKVEGLFPMRIGGVGGISARLIFPFVIEEVPSRIWKVDKRDVELSRGWRLVSVWG